MNEWDVLVNNIRRHGYAILFGLIVGVIFAIFILTFQPPVYQARMIVAPTERTGVPSLGSILPQGMPDTPVLQYFVSRIDAANSSDFTVFETLINSPRLANHLVEGDFPSIPSKNARDMISWLEKNVQVRPVGTTPFREIRLNHHNPETATSILGTLFQETDMMIRRDTNRQTQRRIAYLKQQLEDTRHPDHQDAIIALLKEQEQTAMMVSIDNHFAAKPIEPPSLKPRPVAPNWRILIPALGFGGAVIGFMLGGLIAALRRP
jgi:LPS O-antigen subunit length determinant protein (WzzB/FepE family)